MSEVKEPENYVVTFNQLFQKEQDRQNTLTKDDDKRIGKDDIVVTGEQCKR